MGAAASTAITAATVSYSDEDLKAALSGLTADARATLLGALETESGGAKDDAAERQAEEAAATKMQAMQRGNTARKALVDDKEGGR